MKADIPNQKKPLREVIVQSTDWLGKNWYVEKNYDRSVIR